MHTNELLNMFIRKSMKRFFGCLGLLVFGLYALGMCSAAILAPYFQSKGMLDISLAIYSFLGHHCHQMVDRSLWLFGEPMGLCARCFALYSTFALVTFLLIFLRYPTKYWRIGLLLVIPLLLDGLLQIFGVTTSTNFIRVITGTFGGIGLALILRHIIWTSNEPLLHFSIKKINLRKIYFPIGCLICMAIFALVFLKFNEPAYSINETRIILKQYTPVILLLREDVSSKSKKPGDPVQLSVAENVIVEGKILIKSGTPVIGKVSMVREAGHVGEPGEIAIVPQYVKAVDGQKVRLGGTLYAKGKEKEVSTAVLTAICLPFALRKGGQASIISGTELKAYVERDIQIKVSE